MQLRASVFGSDDGGGCKRTGSTCGGGLQKRASIEGLASHGVGLSRRKPGRAIAGIERENLGKDKRDSDQQAAFSGQQESKKAASDGTRLSVRSLRAVFNLHHQPIRRRAG